MAYYRINEKTNRMEPIGIQEMFNLTASLNQPLGFSVGGFVCTSDDEEEEEDDKYTVTIYWKTSAEETVNDVVSWDRDEHHVILQFENGTEMDINRDETYKIHYGKPKTKW